MTFNLEAAAAGLKMAQLPTIALAFEQQSAPFLTALCKFNVTTGPPRSEKFAAAKVTL
jgi:hypothetical protein